MAVNGILYKVTNIAQNGVQKTWMWDVPNLLATQLKHNHKYAVIVLNRPVSQNEQFMKNLWNDAVVRVTVDGGTNQWDTFVMKMKYDEQRAMKVPDLITGDFDSIAVNILEKYKEKGCKIVHTPNQDYTDFTKALMEVYKFTQEHKIQIDHVMAIAQSSGRLDQVIGNIQTLFLAKDKNLLNSKTRLYLISDDSISWLLIPGQHVISIPESARNYKKSWCSLIPIGETCEVITTTGLKWNLDRGVLKFGDLVSTSNTYDGSDTVTVTCSNTVLWSMRIPDLA